MGSAVKEPNLPLSKTQSPQSFLYTSVIKSHLGEQLSLVVSYLISHGRVSSSFLVQHTGLPLYNVKQSLVSLIQLNIVTYTKDSIKRSVFYNFHELGVLKLCYSGDIINEINLTYKDDSMTQIIQNILENGYLTFKDYNKDCDDNFIRLLQDKWLIPITNLQMQDKYDLYNEVFKNQLLKFNRDNKATSESKKIAEVKQITNVEFQKLISPQLSYTKIVDGETKMLPDIPLTFNLNRFLQRKRSLLLKDLCKHQLGPLSGELYSIILNKFEKNSMLVINEWLMIIQFSNNILITSTGLDPQQLSSLMEDLNNQNMKLTTFNANDILKEVSFINKKLGHTVINLQNSIIDPSSLKKDEDEPPKKRIKLEMFDDVDMMSLDQDNETSIMMQHLQILANGKFLRESSPGKFYIPILEMVEKLQDETMMQLIKLIFGQDALRVVNCIRQVKLLDEKILTNLLLMKDSTIKSNLNKLTMANILQLQEIPKTADRLAIRTVFTFRFNMKQARQLLIFSLYYNLGEILANIDSLKDENKILLDKCSRDDVRGKETEVLIESELVKLSDIYESQLNHMSKYVRVLSLINIFEF